MEVLLKDADLTQIQLMNKYNQMALKRTFSEMREKDLVDENPDSEKREDGEFTGEVDVDDFVKLAVNTDLTLKNAAKFIVKRAKQVSRKGKNIDIPITTVLTAAVSAAINVFQQSIAKTEQLQDQLKEVSESISDYSKKDLKEMSESIEKIIETLLSITTTVLYEEPFEIPQRLPLTSAESKSFEAKIIQMFRQLEKHMIMIDELNNVLIKRLSEIGV